MKDCTYSRYSGRWTRDYIACPERAERGKRRRVEPVGKCSDAARGRGGAGGRRGVGGVLSARARPQSLRREGAPRRGAPGARQSDAWLATDRGGLASTPPPDRSAAVTDRFFLPHRFVRVV